MMGGNRSTSDASYQPFTAGGNGPTDKRHDEWHGNDASTRESSVFTFGQKLAALSKPPVRRYFISLVIIWFTLSFGYYGLATWITVLYGSIGLSNIYMDAFLYAAANLPGNIITYVIIDRISRKTILGVAMVFATIFALLFAVALHNADATLIISLSMVFNMSMTVGWNTVNCFSTECFPTRMRATVIGIVAAFGRIGSISAQFINSSLQRDPVVLLIVTGTNMLLGALAVLLLPYNTSGVSLD